MLNNLDFLRIGSEFPPPAEKMRLDRYAKNKQIFDGEHEKVYADSFRRIERVINNFSSVVSYATIINYQKLITLKTADLIAGEPPKISCGDDNEVHQKSIDSIVGKTQLNSIIYSSAIDMSRFGDSILNIYQDEEGQGTIDIIQPSFYFKVVDARNMKKVINHVLIHSYDAEVERKSFLGVSKEVRTNLYVQIHYKGYYEEMVLGVNQQGTIDKVIEPPKRFNTGLNDFAIVPIHNLLTSDKIYGVDDYNGLDSIISEIEVRISQISKILDKHAEPSVQGSESSLYRDEETGEYKLKMGNFFIRNSTEDPPTEYITWEAQLEANFKQIELLINTLSTVSEMGSALFDNGERVGQVASGTALRRMMISPLAKVARLRQNIDFAIKKAIKLCSQLGGNDVVDLSKENINIFWQDGLPGDPLEEANIMAIRTGNKSTLSQWSAIQRLDNLSDEDVQKELDAIKQDEKDNNPLSNMNFDYGKEAEEVEE